MLCWCTYKGMLSGFMYGVYVPVAILKVTSKKSTTVLFASMIMVNPLSLNILQTDFFIFSTCLGVPVIIPKPSSRYNPKLVLLFFGS